LAVVEGLVLTLFLARVIRDASALIERRYRGNEIE
jgi:hypothetical protein